MPAETTATKTLEATLAPSDEPGERGTCAHQADVGEGGFLDHSPVGGEQRAALSCDEKIKRAEKDSRDANELHREQQSGPKFDAGDLGGNLCSLEVHTN
jgi:hypothetical protein